MARFRPWRTAPLFIIALLVLTGCEQVRTFVAQQSGGQPASLREVDWRAVLTSGLPGVAEERCFGVSLDRGNLCLQVHADLSAEPVRNDQPFNGFALLAPGDVWYADLDGDDVEEAVVRLHANGIGGTIAFLLFAASDPNPRLVSVYGGFYLDVAIEDTAIVVRDPFMASPGDNACPTAFEVKRFSLRDARLVSAGSEWRLGGECLRLFNLEPGYSAAVLRNQLVTSAEVTVAAFYRSLTGIPGAANYYLSPAFRAANPNEEWRALYGDPLLTQLEAIALTEPGPNPRVEFTVAISSRSRTDRTIRRFGGSWTLVADPRCRLGWVLDKADVQPLP